MSETHDHRLLNELRTYSTPLIYDAIERFGVRARNEGYTDIGIQPMFPSMTTVAGYACTGKVVGKLPPAQGERFIENDTVWKYVNESPRPSVMVVQDLDYPNLKGCPCGDLAAAILMALGCVGFITNGAVRDVNEIESMGFGIFASSAIVGHAYVRYLEIGVPVEIQSLTVNPGDLIHADRHGVMVIPREVPLEDLLKVARSFTDSEQAIRDFCRSPEFTIEKLLHRLADHNRRIKA